MIVELLSLNGDRRSERFRTDASEVLSALRGRISDVLAELGNFTRPAEVQRALDLDRTLGWQVFRLARSSDALGNGGVVPSRTSMRKFLDAAKTRGITENSVDNVWLAYIGFEELVIKHAGNRATFNSMVSAVSGVDEEWLAADVQHRRNAYRAMSHTMGAQVKTHLHLAIVNESEDGTKFDIAVITGLYGLRVLRQLPRVRVFGHNLKVAEDTQHVGPEPLGLSNDADGHLLTAFCSQPVPQINVTDGTNPSCHWREFTIDEPEVGETGTSNLVFGIVYRGLPAMNQPLNVLKTSNRPSEVLLVDVLKKRGKAGLTQPTGKASMGNNDKFGTELFELTGKFDPVSVGRGASCLATPEIPYYRDLLDTVGKKLGWDLDEFDAWRIRAEFPIHQSTVTMSWDHSQR